MSIGQRINEHRKKLNLSQEALGDKLNVSRQAVYKWETDQSLPDSNNLIELSKIFEISLSELIGENQDYGVSSETKAVESMSKKNVFKYRVFVATLVMLVIAVFIQTISISNLKGQLESLNQKVSDGSIHRPVYFPVYPTNNEVFNHLDFKIVAVNFNTFEMTYKLDFSMKVESKDAVYTLSMNDNVYNLEKNTNQGFSKEITVPFTETLESQLLIESTDELMTYPIYEGRPLDSFVFAYDVYGSRVIKSNLYIDIMLSQNIEFNTEYTPISEDATQDYSLFYKPFFSSENFKLSHFNFEIIDPDNPDVVISNFSEIVSTDYITGTIVFDNLANILESGIQYDLVVRYLVDDKTEITYKMATLVSYGYYIDVFSQYQESTDQNFKFDIQVAKEN